MTDESYGVRVRPLDESGKPIATAPSRPSPQRASLLTGGAIALIVIIALVAVIAWRALTGSPFGAAESVAADADVVFTVDFLQIRDVERVDRFIRAFADPMVRHGYIDEVPDLDSALREFDDMAEEEIGFRFGEDIVSWVGRSASMAVWIPESALALDSFDPSATPAILITLEVRDDERAGQFLDRAIAEAEQAGFAVTQIQLGGGPGYYIETPDEPLVVALRDGRFLIGESTDTVRRAIELDPADSVAQSEDFQRLASAIGGDPVMTSFASSNLGSKLAAAFSTLSPELPLAEPFAGGSMVTLALDDDGISIRAASRAVEGLTVAHGAWSAALPADTYGFIDVVLPDGYGGELIEQYTETLSNAGLTGDDLDAITAPADDVIGMSLLDDLLPQFGGELMFAVIPASDGLLAQESGLAIGTLLGVGIQDADIVGEALDRALLALAEQGLTILDDASMHVVELDGSPVGALSLTADSFLASSSPQALEGLLRGAERLGAAEQYNRVDDLIDGDGLAMYVDVAGVVGDFVDDGPVRDVLAPLVAVGAGYAVHGDLQITDVRFLIDY